MDNDKIISLDREDFTNIKNLFSNSISVQIQDRQQLRELLDDEENLVNKLGSIQNQRDSLLIESVEDKKKIKKLEEKIKKLEKDASKNS